MLHGIAQPKTTKQPLVTAATYVEPEVYDRLKQLADANRRSISKELGLALERHLEAAA